MKQYRKYIISTVLILIGLSVLCYPILSKQSLPNVIKHMHFPKVPQQSIQIKSIDLTQFNNQQMHHVVTKQQHGHYTISINGAPSIHTTNTLPTAWVIQVNRFAKKDQALQLTSALQQRGFTAFAQFHIDTDSSPVWEVLVGPMLTKSKAKDVLATLKQQMKLDGSVTRYKIGKYE